MNRHGATRLLWLPAVVLLMATSLIAAGCVRTSESSVLPPATPETTPSTPESVMHYTYEVVNAYPHDDHAFTEGLAYEDGILYEGTGLRGRSSLREVQLQTGVVLDSVLLDRNLFGEGITIVGDRILQLTWQSGLGFVYVKNDLQLVGQFAYDTEGWGLTYDGRRLILSDGTDALYFLNPETFAVEGSVAVSDAGTPVTELNELEFVDGLVYANVWKTNSIAIIDPESGRVTGWIDLTGLLETRSTEPGADVLNGIAYDPAGTRLFVTGKLWPWLFEIKLVQS